MTPQEVIQKPLMTEQASAVADSHNQITFKVHPKANKHQIREAIESIYGVGVKKIRTSIFAGKLKRRGMSIGRRSTWKKAIVSLKEGDVIDFFAAE